MVIFFTSNFSAEWSIFNGYRCECQCSLCPSANSRWPPLISVHLHPNEFTNSNNWIGPHFLQLVAILFWQHALKQHYGVGID